jgi:8-oxo-dGTP pyrophosphatase MutT (NUDIX family)
MAITASSDAGSECGEPRQPVVPRLAATVALVRDGADGLEVYLMRRPATMAFAPGAWVVPGGSVDAPDAAVAGSLSTMDGPAGVADSGSTPGTAGWDSTGLSTVDSGRVLAAAVREVFEETAVLLATDATGAVPPLPVRRRVRDRAAVRSGTAGFGDLLRREGLRLNRRLLVPWSRWITPAWVSERRFDTYFFVAALPPGQEPVRARTEASAARWLRPGQALDRYAQHRLQLMVPTRALLAALAGVRGTATLRDELPWRPSDLGQVPAPAGDARVVDRLMRGLTGDPADPADDQDGDGDSRDDRDDKEGRRR